MTVRVMAVVRVVAITVVVMFTTQMVGVTFRGISSPVSAVASPSWTPNTAPLGGLNPPAATPPQVTLNRVSCPVSGWCAAVGSYSGGGLIEILSGGTWTATNPPINGLDPPDRNPSVVLSDVSCPTLGSCVAVGYYGGPSGFAQGLIETYSGGTWTASSIGLPVAGTEGAVLSGISCPTTGSCVAVGYYEAPDRGGLIETLSGGNWTTTIAPLSGLDPAALSPSNVLLNAVSCPASNSCTAVGYYYDTSGVSDVSGLIETLSGGTWTATTATVSGLNPAAGAIPGVMLDSVSCSAPGSCVAAGHYFDLGREALGLLETLAGGTWTATTAPLSGLNPPALTPSYLFGVSCSATGSCVAVGEYADANFNDWGLIETLSGGTWTATTAPLSGLSPTSSTPTSSLLIGVSCPASNSCAAVGYYYNPYPVQQGLIEVEGMASSERYVALGDSIAYGHGLANPGKKSAGGLPTNMGPSPLAYPSLVAESLGLSLSLRPTGCTLTGDNLAVSGAPSIDNHWSGKDTDCHYHGVPVPGHKAIIPNELAAADLGNNPPALVTIQIGANDVDFDGCLTHILGVPENPKHDSTTCVKQDPKTKAFYLPTRVQTELDSLDTGLQSTVATVHREAPGATIAVLNYYQAVPQATERLTGTSFICQALELAQVTAKHKRATLANKRAQADFLQEQVNSEIAAVAGAFSYVTLVDISSVMAGHEMCVGDAQGNSQSWIFEGTWDAGHPTAVGHQEIAQTIESRL